MRVLFSGGAPLSPEIKDYLQVIFSVNMFESYGSTETAGFLTSTAIWDRQGGYVGGILGCCKL
jgi:long-subunit acyl-CoA synthetase (AMP-forming)